MRRTHNKSRLTRDPKDRFQIQGKTRTPADKEGKKAVVVGHKDSLAPLVVDLEDLPSLTQD